VVPAFSFTTEYFLFVLAVTLNALFIMVIGGWIQDRLQKRGLRMGRSTLRKRFWGFMLFIISVLLVGFLSERLQAVIFSYLQQNAATNIIGIVGAVVIAYVLYEWLILRKVETK
jgi:hypothetical protein